MIREHTMMSYSDVIGLEWEYGGKIGETTLEVWTILILEITKALLHAFVTNWRPRGLCDKWWWMIKHTTLLWDVW